MIEQLFYVMMPAVVIFTVLLIALKTRQQRELQKKHNACAKRISNIKAAFKTTLELFAIQRVIRPAHVELLCNIVDNYFIDQPVNEQNTLNLEKLANHISVIIAREINMTRSDTDTEWVQKKLLNFTLNLPEDSQEYNRTFYAGRLRVLLRALNTKRTTYVQQHCAA